MTPRLALLASVASALAFAGSSDAACWSNGTRVFVCSETRQVYSTCLPTAGGPCSPTYVTAPVCLYGGGSMAGGWDFETTSTCR